LWEISKFIHIEKIKLKTLCYVRKVVYKMPQGTHESNGCPYPLWSMVLIIMAIVKQTIFTWMQELADASEECETKNILYFSPT
jgi:hypothetical protein